MKKILLVSTIPLSLKVFSLGLSFMEFLRDKGYDVHAAGGGGREAECIRERGFPYHEIFIPRQIRPLSDLKAFVSLARILKKERFDVVHTQTSKAGFIGRLAARMAGVPVVVHTAHNWPFHQLLPFYLRYFYLMLERLAGHWCDALIVDTRAVKQYGMQCRVIPEEKIHQVYMGIDCARFNEYTREKKLEVRRSLGIGPEKIVIGAISRLVPDKGIETFIDCARRLKDRDDLFFVVGGDGELREQCERDVEASGLRRKFTFLGHLDDVVPYLNAFDVFFLPTLREGFGVIFAEAQACGVPVVASDIGPLREAVDDGETGLLVPPGDTRGFVDALLRVCEPQERARMSLQARQYVRNNFAVSDIHEKTRRLYQTLWDAREKRLEKR
ncbi:MAG: hypothetical protein DRP85_07635 [Candidatus Makaraimicrobium thalassicum]|nr:MAG: hypothetical protein DRP85_07635 [Candidatus Omnitrophota bacterium]